MESFILRTGIAYNEESMIFETARRYEWEESAVGLFRKL